MSEFLEMLKTEDGQPHAVFACFGSAAQHAQMFEDALCQFLIAYKRVCNRKLVIADLETTEAKLRKKTMGGLLTDLRKFVDFNNDPIERELDAALTARNFLMHRFFLDRCEGLKTEDGRMALIRELLAGEQILESATNLTNGMRVALCRVVGDFWKGIDSGESASPVVARITIELPD